MSDWPFAGADSGWLVPTLLNSWVNNGGSEATAAYRKVGNTVYIKGAVKSGSSAGAAMFLLPVGYRPDATHRWVTPTNGGGHCQMAVDSAGNVFASSGGDTGNTFIDTVFMLGS